MSWVIWLVDSDSGYQDINFKAGWISDILLQCLKKSNFLSKSFLGNKPNFFFFFVGVGRGCSGRIINVILHLGQMILLKNVPCNHMS